MAESTAESMAESTAPGPRPGTVRRRNGGADLRPVSSGQGIAGRAVPVRLEIPAIDLRAGVVAIGLDADGNLAVPPQPDGPVAWYERSPLPGEPGSAVMVGHVDAPHGAPAVFARLRLLMPGDTASVRRADRSVVRFVVTGIARYPKDHFPGDRLLGPSDYPALTLMTCGGVDHDHPGQGSNVIVFARRAG